MTRLSEAQQRWTALEDELRTAVLQRDQAPDQAGVDSASLQLQRLKLEKQELAQTIRGLRRDAESRRIRSLSDELAADDEVLGHCIDVVQFAIADVNIVLDEFRAAAAVMATKLRAKPSHPLSAASVEFALAAYLTDAIKAQLPKGHGRKKGASLDSLRGKYKVQFD